MVGSDLGKLDMAERLITFRQRMRQMLVGIVIFAEGVSDARNEEGLWVDWYLEKREGGR